MNIQDLKEILNLLDFKKRFKKELDKIKKAESKEV